MWIRKLHHSIAPVVLQTVLLIAAASRVSAISFIYLFGFITLLFYPLSSSCTAHRIVTALRVYAFAAIISQLVFQIYLGSQGPYAKSLSDDSVAQNTLTQFGFVRFDVIWHTAFRYLIVDVAVAGTTMVVPSPNVLGSSQQHSIMNNARIEAIWNALSDRGVWMLIGTFLITSTTTSAPGIVMYIGYLSLLVAFIFSRLRAWVAIYRPFLSTVLILYLVGTYSFQFPIIYKYLQKHADVLGLVTYYKQYPPTYHASNIFVLNDLKWPHWLLLFAQIFSISFVVCFAFQEY